MKISRIDKSIHTESSLPRAWGEGDFAGKWQGVANGYMVSYWGNENILKMIVVMVIQLCEYTKTI